MPLGHTATTSFEAGNFSPMDSRWPSKKPCERPKTAPGLSALKISLYNVACAASEMSKMTKSLALITSYISPSVPLALEKPTASASE